MPPQLTMDTILCGHYLLLLMSKTYEKEDIISTNQTIRIAWYRLNC